MNAVVTLEEGVLEPELLESIINNLPPETEAKALRALRNVTPASLANPERFCYEMARLPRLRPSVVVDGRNVTTPAVFIRKHPGLLRELRRHHSCAEGDGADADSVLLAADVIMPAFIRS